MAQPVRQCSVACAALPQGTPAVPRRTEQDISHGPQSPFPRPDRRVDLAAARHPSAGIVEPRVLWIRGWKALRSEGPSRTAWSAACHRGVHQVIEAGRIFADPLALTVLGDDAAAVVEHAREQPRRRPMRIFIATRHRVAEDALARDVAGGTRQVVVLGAGLDTLAYRSPFGANGVRVFEVDHPATQEWKRDLLRRTGIPVPETAAYVPVDFETQDLADRLIRSGVDLDRPVFFLWLGVVPYLTTAAVWQTLGTVARVPNATVAFDYANPVDQLSAELQEAHTRRAESVRALGEPWLSYFDTPALHADLEMAGLRVVEDVGPTDIAVRFFGAPPDSPQRPGGHVLVATRRPV